ncbi:unnamed protein product [Xylocopa violacea]|uniref:Odorant receptor n=1 Tax=Xylocopa violacea TaxID=135666 RepID=A0ABP1N9S4_XYLVO
MANETVAEKSNLNNYSDYNLKLNRWILKPIGVWPASPSTSKLQRTVSVISNVVCYSFMVSTSIMCLLHLLLELETVYAKLEILGALNHWFVSNVTYTTLLLRSNDIRDCVQQMETDWRTVAKTKYQEVMLKYAVFGRYVATFCVAFMQGGVLSFCFVTAMSTEEIQVGNETKMMHVIPFPVYKRLLNVEENPMNAIVLFAEIFAIFIANSCTAGTFSLAAVLAAHACGQLGVVKVRLVEFVDKSRNQEKGSAFGKMGAIVEHHLRTLNFIACMEKMMSRIYFLEFFRCMLAICLIMYMFLMDLANHNVKNMATLCACVASICLNIFIMCYISEVLKAQVPESDQVALIQKRHNYTRSYYRNVNNMNSQQCKEVGDVIYMTNWYNLPNKLILDLILIIVRSNLAVDITAGKIIHLSIYTFGHVSNKNQLRVSKHIATNDTVKFLENSLQ